MKRSLIIVAILCYSLLYGAQPARLPNKLVTSQDHYVGFDKNLFTDDLAFEKALLKSSVIYLGLWALPHLINMAQYSWKRYKLSRRINGNLTNEHIKKYVTQKHTNMVLDTTVDCLDRQQFSYARDNTNNQSNNLVQLAQIASDYVDVTNDESIVKEIAHIQQNIPQYKALQSKWIALPFYLVSKIPYTISCLWYGFAFLRHTCIMCVCFASQDPVGMCFGVMGLFGLGASTIAVQHLQNDFVPQFRIIPRGESRRLHVAFEEKNHRKDNYRKLGENLMASTLYFGASFASLFFISKSLPSDFLMKHYSFLN